MDSKPYSMAPKILPASLTRRSRLFSLRRLVLAVALTCTIFYLYPAILSSLPFSNTPASLTAAQQKAAAEAAAGARPQAYPDSRSRPQPADGETTQDLDQEALQQQETQKEGGEEKENEKAKTEPVGSSGRTQPNRKKKKKKLLSLEAHIMSKCPDAADCLHDLVVPAMARVANLVDFRLYFIGSIGSDGKSVACKHGPDECIGNEMMLCAQAQVATEDDDGDGDDDEQDSGSAGVAAKKVPKLMLGPTREKQADSDSNSNSDSDSEAKAKAKSEPNPEGDGEGGGEGKGEQKKATAKAKKTPKPAPALSQTASLGFANCLLAKYEQVPAWSLAEGCAKEFGVDVDALKSCVGDGNKGDGGDGKGKDSEGQRLLRRSVAVSKFKGVQYSCTVRLQDETWCVRDSGEWKHCGSHGGGVDALVAEIRRRGLRG